MWPPPAREAVADAPSRQFLQQQAGDMPTRVVAHIDEQGRVIIFRQETAMKFCKTGSPHVRNMNVSDLSLRLLMHNAAIVFDPLAITGGHFVGHGLDGANAGFFRGSILDGKLY